MAVFTKIGLDEINLIEKNFSIGKILNYSGIKKGIENTNYLIKSKKRKFIKGDIIFWKGHVAMCLNSKKLIHAYGPEKKVIIMPIIKTVNRIEKTAKLKVKKVSRIKY